MVIDTDVASRLFRHKGTGPLARRLSGGTLYVTFVTVGELWKWAHLRGWGLRSKVQLIDFLETMTVVPCGEAVARRWGAAAAAAAQRGRTPSVNDSWIAACCLARELRLATLNVKDFADLAENEGLQLLGV